MSKIRPDVTGVGYHIDPADTERVAAIAAVEHGIALLAAAVDGGCRCYHTPCDSDVPGHSPCDRPLVRVCNAHRLLAEQRALLEEVRG